MTRLVAVLFVGAIAIVSPSQIAAAAPSPEYTLIDSGFRGLVDATPDGRFVLTAGLASPPARVIDRSTGVVRSLDTPNAPRAISADGTHIILTTSAALVPGDIDGDDDVYSMRISDESVTLLTPGLPNWGFDVVGGTSADGSRVLVRGINGLMGASAPFLIDGGTVTELGTSLGAVSTASAVWGLTDDGRYALYSSSRCPGVSWCLPALYREDLTTHQILPLARTANDLPMSVASAELSGNGGCVIVVVDPPHNQLMRDCTLTPHGMASVPGAHVYPSGAVDPLLVSMSNDGGIFTWMQLVHAAGALSETPQLMVARGANSAEVLSTMNGTPAARGISSGFITEDGRTLLLETFESDFVANPNGDRAIVSRTIAAPAQVDASTFAAAVPLRIVDTRTSLGYSGAMPTSETRINVPIRGVHGVPENASAVAVQVTATDGMGTGFVSVLPGGSPAGFTSNLNLDTPGETIANMAVVPIGPDGSIDLFLNAATHVIVDLSGWWTPTPIATAAGRYQAVGPSRVLDTRPRSATGPNAVRSQAGETTSLQVTGAGGVPAHGVTAVAVNLTLVAPSGPGYVQIAPADSLVVGASSTVNVSTAGQTIAASTIVPVDAQGRIAIYTQPSTHLIVDVSGWFTDSSVAAGTDGMFVPLSAVHRDVDTRIGLGFVGPTSDGTRFDVVASGGAWVGNVTVTGNAGPGFVQLGPAGTMLNGATSNINPSGPNETIANAFIVPVASGVGVFTSNATHVLIDVSGYMTGS